MLATEEKDLQALSLLPPLNNMECCVWVELMQQLLSFSNRKEKCRIIKLLKKQILLYGQWQTVGQMAAFESVTA